jgi:hypothetical protein
LKSILKPTNIPKMLDIADKTKEDTIHTSSKIIRKKRKKLTFKLCSKKKGRKRSDLASIESLSQNSCSDFQDTDPMLIVVMKNDLLVDTK